MDIKDRLLEFIKSQNISNAKFERDCGLSNGYINSIRKSISIDKLEQILRAFPNLRREWLMNGEGDMLISSQELSEPPSVAEDQKGGNHNINVQGNASNIQNFSQDGAIVIALNEISEMRKLLAEVIDINKEQSKRLIIIVDKLSDKI